MNEKYLFFYTSSACHEKSIDLCLKYTQQTQDEPERL